MDKYYVIVAGEGITSRANVEALIEDYVYANGKDVTFLLPFEKSPSTGQTFIAQWAKDKSKDIVVFCNETAKFDGLPGASLVTTESPYKEAAQFLKAKGSAVAFILWNEGAREIVNMFNDHSVNCYDLTNGFNLLEVEATYVEQEDEPIVEELIEAPKALQVPDDLYAAIIQRLLDDGYISKKPSKGV